jgi:gliding motility-associated-like protein
MKKPSILAAILLASISGISQTASPTVYSSTGGTGSVNANFIVDYTVGECVVITLDPQNGTHILTQGFQQPLNDSIILPGGGNPDSLLGIFTGLTPNGDGHNEIWYISGIDTLPDNAVYIHNRWGELIWKGEQYDNVNVYWDGKNMKGEEVISGTYYFAIMIRGKKSYVGWVELSR